VRSRFPEIVVLSIQGGRDRAHRQRNDNQVTRLMNPEIRTSQPAQSARRIFGQKPLRPSVASLKIQVQSYLIVPNRVIEEDLLRHYRSHNRSVNINGGGSVRMPVKCETVPAVG